MKWLLRPVVLIAVSALLVAAAALFVFRPVPGAAKPQRSPLRQGDSEVAFIYPATSGTTWDRFVAGVRHSHQRLQEIHPGLEVYEHAAPGSTETPEVVLEWPNGRRLLFRWYKVTNDWPTEAWIKELLRPPYPLALVGGGNSTAARTLALGLRDAGYALPEESRPLLLLTTATADRVSPPLPPIAAPPVETVEALTGLTDTDTNVYHPGIYEGRTYRFCFSNRQMASAVTHFIWMQPDLRPEGDPLYLVQWMDDSYSRDLVDGYTRVVRRRDAEDLRASAALTIGVCAMRQPLAAVPAWWAPSLRNDPELLWFFPLDVQTSVGPFSSPNRYEAQNARSLLNNLAERHEPGGYKHLLVVTGQAQPSRRFLRELARSSPEATRRLVVVSGDAISFNAVYRDRAVLWPIQDLPFPFVFCCHRNPISAEAGFLPLEALGDRPSAQSGTDDLLLFAEIAESLGLIHGGKGDLDAAGLAAGMDRLRWSGGRVSLGESGRLLFSPRNKGARNRGTGEHVVCLRPAFTGERVLPEATVEVWYSVDDERGLRFRRLGGPGGALKVSYVESKPQGERQP